MPGNRTHLNPAWKLDPKFKEWLGVDPESKFNFYCKKCLCTCELGNVGKGALKKHLKAKKHAAMKAAKVNQLDWCSHGARVVIPKKRRMSILWLWDCMLKDSMPKFLWLLILIMVLLQLLKTPENLFGYYFLPILGMVSAKIKNSFWCGKKSGKTHDRVRKKSGKVRNLAFEKTAGTLLIFESLLTQDMASKNDARHGIE